MNSNWRSSPKTPILGQIDYFFVQCYFEIWLMALKNNKAPLLNHIKLCASLHYHMWIQAGVTFRKPLNWDLTSETLTFDLWLWYFVWTSLLSVVKIPEDFMMIWWWRHRKKRCDRQTETQTDGQTDGRTDWTIYRATWSQLNDIVSVTDVFGMLTFYLRNSQTSEIKIVATLLTM